MRENNEHDTVSQSINDELNKVMELLQSPKPKAEQVTQEVIVEEEEIVALDDVSRESSTITPFNVDSRAVHAGNLQVHAAFDSTCLVDAPPVTAENSEVVSNVNHIEDGLVGPMAPAEEEAYDGVNVLMDEESMDTAPDAIGDSLRLMNNTLSDCMDILEKARVRTAPSTLPPCHAEDDELSLVTEKLD